MTRTRSKLKMGQYFGDEYTIIPGSGYHPCGNEYDPDAGIQEAI